MIEWTLNKAILLCFTVSILFVLLYFAVSQGNLLSFSRNERIANNLASLINMTGLNTSVKYYVGDNFHIVVKNSTIMVNGVTKPIDANVADADVNKSTINIDNIGGRIYVS